VRDVSGVHSVRGVRGLERCHPRSPGALALGGVGDRVLLHAALSLRGEVGLALERLLVLLLGLLVLVLRQRLRGLAHLDKRRPLLLLLVDGRA
jgi:hypothetical protein